MRKVRYLHSFLVLASNGNYWSALCSDRFTFGPSEFIWTFRRKENLLLLVGIKPIFYCLTAHKYLLYWLRFIDYYTEKASFREACQWLKFPLNVLRAQCRLSPVVGLLPLASGPACFSNWQKESCQTFEETSGYVRPERVNKWPSSMTDIRGLEL